MIQEHFSLRNLNSFGIDCYCSKYVELTNPNQLQEISKLLKSGEPYLILGGGSNILFTTDFTGIVIHNKLKGISIAHTGSHPTVTASAGENWHHLVQFCIEHNLAGIENLSLIPGTVGAAPIQNIGAYGVELKEVFKSLVAWNIGEARMEEIDNKACNFGYRNSIFKNQAKNKYIIVSVTLQLSHTSKVTTHYGAIESELKKRNFTEPTIKNISDIVIGIRQSKLPDPAVIGNAGSFFKNPEIEKSHFEKLKESFPNIVGYPAGSKIKCAAGWLIEQCGYKGKRIGNAGCHKDQALVLVNLGGATGSEVLHLSTQIIVSVKSKFDIELEREVNII
ncbi:MAG: UDP-N-acetylmuramate dehydrogenase [Bacteroidetes bacterium]|nr:UDP-N-acetylmuramate dehydrogenase [Bacteroidota bacterium]